MLDSSPERGVDLYELLEVSANASPEVIQAAYKVLARTWHPDVRKDPAAERRIRDINSAYHVLSDTGRRATYDLQRARARRHDRLSGVPTHLAGRPAPTLASRGRVDVLAARQRARTEPIERVSALSGRLLAAMVAVATVVSVVVLLLWLTFVWATDEPQPIDRGAIVEMRGGPGAPSFVAPSPGS